MSDPENIEFDLTVPIADFGLGSDAPIVLDYRRGPVGPGLLFLDWSNPIRPRWADFASSFDQFTNLLHALLTAP